VAASSSKSGSWFIDRHVGDLRSISMLRPGRSTRLSAVAIDILVAGDVDVARDVEFVEIPSPQVATAWFYNPADRVPGRSAKCATGHRARPISSGPVADRSRWSFADQGPLST
jgi:hypothetical protein